MKKKSLLHLLLALSAFVFVFVSCSDDNDDPEYFGDYTSIVVNQGNLSEKNGSISYYRESDNAIANGVFKKANGREFASIIESATVSGTTAFIICNEPSKIEIIDVNTAKTLSAPIEADGLATPRYAVISGDYIYVSCWGEKQPDYTFVNPCVLKIKISSKEIIKKIDYAADSYPEGLLLMGNKLYVAINGGVDVYDTTTDTKINTISFTSLSGKACQFAIDKNGMIWCSVENYDMTNDKKGIVVLSPQDLTVVNEIAGYNVSGQISINKAKDKVIFYSIVYGDKNKSSVYTIDIETKTVTEEPLFEGEYFYGINVNPKTGIFYTAEVFGFTGNSMLKTFNEQGALVKQAEAGVGACRFVFF